MAKKEKVISEITCDYCHGKITERSNRVDFQTGHVGQGTDWHACTVKVDLKGCIPYATGDADMCSRCAASFLRRAADILDDQNA